MRIDPVDPSIRARAVAAAQGREPFDLLLTGGTVVDVGCGELRAGRRRHRRPARRERARAGRRAPTRSTRIDCTGRFVAPGFIDMHVHFESSMLTPGGYAEAVCPRGTTTVFVDPHELANVAGRRRRALHGRGEPRPAGAVHRAGAVVRAAATRARAVGRRPVRPRDRRDARRGTRSAASPRSWTCSACSAAPTAWSTWSPPGSRAASSCRATRPGSPVPVLQAYLAAGMTSDHEIFTEPDCLEKLRAGHDGRAARDDRPDPARHRRRGEQPADPADASRRRDRRPLRAHAAQRRRHRPPAAPARRLRHGPAARAAVRDLQRRVPAAARRPRSRRRRAGAPTSSCSPTSSRSPPSTCSPTAALVASHGRMLVDVVEGPERSAARHDAARRARRRPTCCCASTRPTACTACA